MVLILVGSEKFSVFQAIYATSITKICVREPIIFIILMLVGLHPGLVVLAETRVREVAGSNRVGVTFYCHHFMPDDS